MSRSATVRSELQLGFDALEAAAARDERKTLIDKLVPLAQELAQRAGKSGITVANLRHAAVRRGLLPQTSKDRALSFLGSVMRTSRLIAIDEWRRSDVVRSHGNAHRVWVSPFWYGKA